MGTLLCWTYLNDTAAPRYIISSVEMKKRLYQIKLKHFKDKKENQIYFFNKDISGFELLLRIEGLKQIDCSRWIVYLEDDTKQILTSEDFISYRKRTRDG
tara:strand:- start:493 stop:792 length:300 start_codon:yes stop_codon:yes gene_type:complete